MSDMTIFLRSRYAEARGRENGKRRKIPSVFDEHDVEIRYQEGVTTVLVDGHPYPEDQYYEAATEPAPDPDVIADLDAKLGIVDLHVSVELAGLGALMDACAVCEVIGKYPEYPCTTLRLLAQPFASHPDHKGEEWAP